MIRLSLAPSILVVVAISGQVDSIHHISMFPSNFTGAYANELSFPFESEVEMLYKAPFGELQILSHHTLAAICLFMNPSPPRPNSTISLQRYQYSDLLLGWQMGMALNDDSRIY